MKKIIFSLIFIAIFAISTNAEDIQTQRKAFIEKLIRVGIFTKVVKPASLPHVYVDYGFYKATVDQKKAFLNVVYVYYSTEDPSINGVVLYDGHNGKNIGTYSQLGLDLDRQGATP